MNQFSAVFAFAAALHSPANAQEPDKTPLYYSNRLEDYYPKEFVKAYRAWENISGAASMRLPLAVHRLKQGNVDADTRRVELHYLVSLANQVMIIEEALPEIQRIKGFQYETMVKYIAVLEKELGKETVKSLPVILAKGDPEQMLKIAEALRLAYFSVSSAGQESR